MKDSRTELKKYFSPTATQVTKEQATKFIMDRQKCTQEQAKSFMDSLKEQQPTDLQISLKQHKRDAA